MRVRRVRLRLPARFASTAAPDSRIIVESVVRALHGAGISSSEIRAEMSGGGRDVRALASAVAMVAGTRAKGR